MFFLMEIWCRRLKKEVGGMTNIRRNRVAAHTMMGEQQKQK